MKKIVFFFAMMVFIIALGTNCYGAVTLDILNPVTCTRGTGDPKTEVCTFSSALAGPATMKVENGGLENTSIERVSSSTITLNGKLVFGPNEFNQNVDRLEKTVALVKGPNNLQVTLKGKTGGRISIQIIQSISNITVVPTSVRLTALNPTSQLTVMGKLSAGTAVKMSESSDVEQVPRVFLWNKLSIRR